MSPEERAIELASLAESISGIIGPNTPQSQALEWLVETDPSYACPQDVKTATQRYVMAVFYYSTGGAAWNECSAPADPNDAESVREANEACTIQGDGPGNDGGRGSDAWLGPGSECRWGGAFCFRDGGGSEKSDCMDGITFEENNLVGTLPFELQELSELRYLHVEGVERRRGGLSGPIPPQLGRLTNLLEFDVNYNTLTGPIPDTFYDLRDLIQLDLNDNELTGIIDERIRNLGSLRLMQLHVNQFEGDITPAIGEITSLNLLTFDGNRFMGSMPQVICDNRSTNGGNLVSLTADCADANYEFYVECTCCTFCFPVQQG